MAALHAPLDAATEAAQVQRYTSLPEGAPLGGHDLGTQYQVLRSQAAAAQAFDGTGVFEITTNLPEAGAFFESRIQALRLSGYVRLVPFNGG